MTITVSIEELKAYRDAMETWTRKRGAIIAQWVAANHTISHDIYRHASFDRSRFDAELKAYDEANPMPKILPLI